MVVTNREPVVIPNPSPTRLRASDPDSQAGHHDDCTVHKTWLTRPASVSNRPPHKSCLNGQASDGRCTIVQTSASVVTKNGVIRQTAIPADERHSRQGWTAIIP